MEQKSTESCGRYLCSRPEARALLGLKRRQFDQLVAAGELVLQPIGPRYYVPRAQVDALIARWTTATAELDELDAS